MRKFRPVIAIFLIICTLSSCATVFGGRVNAYQRTKPVEGQEQRPLRVGAFVADVLLFWPGLIVDFATCAIYRPNPPADAPTPPAKTQGKSAAN